MSKIQKNKKVGRPSKLTPKVLKIMEEVIDEYIYCTDKELLFLLNEKLAPGERIAPETFADWKYGRSQSNSLLISEFSRLVEKALLKQKMKLLSALERGEPGWQAKAWILERKFAEWNLKYKQEINTNININQPPKIEIIPETKKLEQNDDYEELE